MPPPPAIANPAPSHRRHRCFTNTPARQGGQGHGQLQHGTGGGDKAHGKVRRVEPAQHGDTQDRRIGRPEDQGDVDGRRGVGNHRVNRQADQRIEARRHGLQPRRHRPVAKCPRHGKTARRIDLRQSRQTHQQQERYLLDHQPRHHRQAPGIVQDQHVRRPVPAGDPRRDGANQQPGRRDQERQAERRRRMGHGQQRRDGAAHPSIEARATTPSEKQQDDAKRHDRRHKPAEQADKDRAPQSGLAEQRIPMVEGQDMAAESWH
jgi:hypothetical protein